MAITVKSIYNSLSSRYKLKLIAGKGGLSQYVSWVYYTEDQATIEFIRGGELAITTGLNIERQKINSDSFNEDFTAAFLKELIDNFIAHHASGLIINTGKYINEVPAEIISWCDQMSFPLFTMPWEVHTIDVMQDIGNKISADDFTTNSLGHFFYKAIFESNQVDFNQIENTSFYDTKTYTIVLVELNLKFFKKDLEQAKRYVKYSLNPLINFPSEKYCSFIHKQKIIYVIKNDSSFFEKELIKLIRSDKIFKNMKISVSDSCDDISELPVLFNHSEIAMRLGKSKGEIHRYNDLGIFKLLNDVKNQKTLTNIYDDVFGKLETLEKDKREDYLRTLYLFLKHCGNFQLVAEENSIHRNTAIYRISRLEELMNVDLSDGETRCLIMTALHIKELL